MLVLREGKRVPDLIYEAKKVGVMPTNKSGLDGLFAAVGLVLTLKKSGKEAKLIFPYGRPQELSEFVSDKDFSRVKGAKDLVVNIKYGDTEIEKINYFVEGDVCKIVVHPVAKDFDLSKVTFEKTGFDFDLVISLGAQKLEDHDEVVKEFGEDLKKIAVINVDNAPNNENFGTLNVVEP